MAITAHVYGLSLVSLAKGEVDFDTASVKALLCTSTYAPSQDTHQYRSSLTNEAAGAGYTAGGVALTGVTVTYDAATNQARVNADDVVFAAVTVTDVRYLVFYINTGVPATSPLLAWWNLGANVNPVGSDLQFTLDDAGFYVMAAAA
jgi:hypothetical protein